jgi:hypothetical protein
MDRPSARATGAAVVASAAHSINAAVTARSFPLLACTAERRQIAVSDGTLAPLAKDQERSNSNHINHTVNLRNSIVTIEYRPDEE